jgi:hypothetical protein
VPSSDKADLVQAHLKILMSAHINSANLKQELLVALTFLP